MTILDQLSSRLGDRTERSNKVVAALCLENTNLLSEIAEGLSSADGRLVADCAEVMVTVAQADPSLVALYSRLLTPLVTHKNNHARWEAIHALALTVHLAPETAESVFDTLACAIRDDESVIVRDYSVQTIASYAGVGPDQARRAYPVLVEAVAAWNGKQAHHALAGLRNVIRRVPALGPEVRALAERCVGDRRLVVQKAVRALIRDVAPNTGR